MIDIQINVMKNNLISLKEHIIRLIPERLHKEFFKRQFVSLNIYSLTYRNSFRQFYY